MAVLQGNIDRFLAETDESPAAAIRTEVVVHSETHDHPNSATDRRQILFCHVPMSKALTVIGAASVNRTCIHAPDVPGKVMPFSLALRPDFPHDARFVEKALPSLYPEGVSGSDLPEALAELSEPDMLGIAAEFFSRFAADVWGEFDARLPCNPLLLYNTHGVGFSAHPDHHRQCLLIVISADAQGEKEGISPLAGRHERAPIRWELPLDLNPQRLENGLEPAVGDGAPVFWKVLRAAHGKTRELRRWEHESGNDCNRALESLEDKAESRPFVNLVTEIRAMEAMNSQMRAIQESAERLRKFLMTDTNAMEAMNSQTRAIQENSERLRGGALKRLREGALKRLREGALIRTRYLPPPGIRAAMDAESRPRTISLAGNKAANAGKSLTEAIREQAHRQREGALIRAKDLLHLGNRAAIDKALSRLAEQGQFLRISRGIYVRTLECEFGRYAPSTEKVIRNIARTTGETIMPHAAIAAKNWGLTTQVPLRISFITTGRERALKFGGQTVSLRRAPSWQFDVGNRAAGLALRVLNWIGPEESTNALHTLKSKLSASDFQEMRMLASSLRANLPPWLSRRVKRASVDG